MAEGWQTEAVDDASELPLRPLVLAVILASGYALLCGTYIVLSGRLAARVSSDVTELASIELLKGLGFVAATGLLFFGFAWWLLRRLASRQRLVQRQQQALVAQNRRSLAVLALKPSFRIFVAWNESSANANPSLRDIEMVRVPPSVPMKLDWLPAKSLASRKLVPVVLMVKGPRKVDPSPVKTSPSECSSTQRFPNPGLGLGGESIDSKSVAPASAAHPVITKPRKTQRRIPIPPGRHPGFEHALR